jgi:hypothetical protein
MFALTHDLSNERAGILQVRAQLHHDRVARADLCELLDTSEFNIPAHVIQLSWQQPGARGTKLPID